MLKKTMLKATTHDKTALEKSAPEAVLDEASHARTVLDEPSHARTALDEASHARTVLDEASHARTVLDETSHARTVPKKPVGRPKDETLPARRKQEILEAAAPFFAENGFRAADLRLLADQIGIAKGTLYRYFPSKQDLFLAAFDRCMSRLHEEVQSEIKNIHEPLERVRAAIATYFRFFETHPYVAEMIILERAEFKDRKTSTYFTHRQAHIGPWQDLFRKLMAEGSLRTVSVKSITDVLSNLVYGTMFANYFAGRDKSLETQTEEILDIVFNGLRAQSGATIAVRGGASAGCGESSQSGAGTPAECPSVGADGITPIVRMETQED